MNINQKKNNQNSGDFNKQKIDDALKNIIKKIDNILNRYISTFPSSNTINYVYSPVNHFLVNDDWTSGFWTGELWLSYLYTKDEKYKKIAESHRKIFQRRLEQEIGLDHHDIGFLYIPSTIAQYKITGDKNALNVSLNAANYLYEKRFNKKLGFIQAWGKMDNPTSIIIVDSLLNIPIFFWRYSITSEKKYLDAALSHLNIIVNYVLRNDDTTYHSYLFDKKTNKPLKGETVQGFNDNSLWARGQGWAIYGFALSYKYTKDEKYYDLFIKVTDKYFKELSSDLIPYWDLHFKDGSNQPKDTSTIGIVASGILLMHKLKVTDKTETYRSMIIKSIDKLLDEYSTFGNKEEEGLIKEGVYNMNSNNGVNESNLWGDYFLFETLIKLLDTEFVEFW